jgi:broad specificity phosphatase PhoE
MIADSCTVYLVRHGEARNPGHIVYADLPGFSLSPTGRRQAESVAERLPDDATVVTSPLARALETATIITERRNGHLVVDESFTEWGLGMRWAGHPWESLDELFPGELAAYLDHPEHLTFSPESLADLARRIGNAVKRHRLATTGPLVIVSHQDPIQAARLSLTGRQLAELNRDKPEHAGVIELESRPTRPWVECATWTPDLDEIDPLSAALRRAPQKNAAGTLPPFATEQGIPR